MRSPLAVAAAAAFLALVGTGCESDPAQDICPASADLRQGYPEGGHGVGEGSVLADLDFLRPDGSAFRLSDIHHDGSKRLLLISTAAEWCTACIEEQPVLNELQSAWSDKGLFVLVAVFEDAGFQPADPAIAGKWKRSFDLDVEVVADTPFHFKDYYDEQLTPMNMFVDVCTMKIVKIIQGFDRGLVEALIESRL